MAAMNDRGPRGIPMTPILLVDDNDANAAHVQSCLAEAGFAADAVIRVQTLGDAVAALQAGPRCILLGLGLADAEDGSAVVRKMMDAAPHVAVIVLTGRPEQDGVEALAAGAQDYLAKDALTGELLERSIRYAIERKRTQRAQEQLREVRMSASEKSRLERGLLPTPLLRTPGVVCSTYYQPGRDHAVLGGDFYDVIETSDGRVRAVVGDVMGHGPDEAALGVHLRVAWRTLLLAGTPDAQVLPTLERLLEAEPDVHRRYVTVCDVTLDGDGATVRSAGHPAPILCTDRKCSYSEIAVGAPLGVRLPETPAPDWPETRLSTPPGTSVLLYTDGLLDLYAGDAAAADSLGIDEMVAAVERCMGEQVASDWIARVLAGAPGESDDDTAVVILTVTS